jgi:hypothetical protein
MYTFGFEKLEVWIESKELTKQIYKITVGFPDSEKFGLTSQLRRASVSICSNIAEGTTEVPLRIKRIFQQFLLVQLLKFLTKLSLLSNLGLSQSLNTVIFGQNLKV